VQETEKMGQADVQPQSSLESEQRCGLLGRYQGGMAAGNLGEPSARMALASDNAGNAKEFTPVRDTSLHLLHNG